MQTVYRSKVGAEIIALIAAGLIPAALTVGFDKDSVPEDLGIMLGISAFSVGLLFSMWYKIDGTMLRIYATVIPYRPIDITTITKIEETSNPLSAPAASLDRLGITHSGGYMLISPKKKAAFIAQLQEINPNIVFIPRSKK